MPRSGIAESHDNSSLLRDLHTVFQASLVAQLVKNPPAIWETWVRSLRWEDPLEKGKATHSSIRPGEFCIMENSREFMACIVHAVAKSWTQLSDFHITSYCFPYCLHHFRSHQQMYEGSLHTLSNIYL